MRTDLVMRASEEMNRLRKHFVWDRYCKTCGKTCLIVQDGVYYCPICNEHDTSRGTYRSHPSQKASNSKDNTRPFAVGK